MAKISLEGMEFYAHHGHYDEERERGNKFVVDLHFETDITKSAATDNLSDTVSYEDVYNVIKEQMAGRSKLLENAAQRIADALKAKFPKVSILELKLSKLNPRLKGAVQKVSVTINSGTGVDDVLNELSEAIKEGRDTLQKAKKKARL